MAVWSAVRKFGFAQTGGAEGALKTDGLYRYSRNPQYVADASMIFGWLVLSSSAAALLVGATSIFALLIAPLAEESWMKERYGRAYEAYMKVTPRYFGQLKPEAEKANNLTLWENNLKFILFILFLFEYIYIALNLKQP